MVAIDPHPNRALLGPDRHQELHALRPLMLLVIASLHPQYAEGGYFDRHRDTWISSLSGAFNAAIAGFNQPQIRLNGLAFAVQYLTSDTAVHERLNQIGNLCYTVLKGEDAGYWQNELLRELEPLVQAVDELLGLSDETTS